MMTDWMVWVRHADLRIRTIVLLARELECDDARDIRLKSQNLQIEHELRVVGKLRRDTYRSIEVAQLGICCRVLGTLDLPFDLTNTIEILIHTDAIGNSHALLEPRDVQAERVQQTPSIAQPRAARGSLAAFAEQALEDDARMCLGRKRSRRRRP